MPTEKTVDSPEMRRTDWSVKTKGLLVILALTIYAGSLSVYSFYNKGQLRQQFNEIQQSQTTEAMLKEADVAAFSAMMAIIAHNVGTGDPTLSSIHHRYSVLHAQHSELAVRLPQFNSGLAQSDAAMAAASKEPSVANINRLMTELGKVEQNYITFSERLAKARARQADRLRTQADSSAMATVWLGLLGLVALVVITWRFFNHLTADLRTLQVRALEIVKGYRGEAIPIRRRDEVGQLMAAVNNMASALDSRERELMLERQKYFHQEKMAAIGTMAAGVAHEIGNPIAAIAGMAQEMAERRAARASANLAHCQECRPDLLYAQTQRLASITREISEVAAPQVSETQLLDLNEHLRGTIKLIRYDKRLRLVELRLDLDPQLPAIQGIPDQLTQLIMNLLINAMDAVEDVQSRPSVIVVSTRSEGERVRVTVEDNGHGMDKDVLSHAFDAFFTTKPAGKGTGLGLALCYSIMQNHGGSIEIDSTQGAGTRVQLSFPVEPATAT